MRETDSERREEGREKRKGSREREENAILLVSIQRCPLFCLHSQTSQALRAYRMLRPEAAPFYEEDAMLGMKAGAKHFESICRRI